MEIVKNSAKDCYPAVQKTTLVIMERLQRVLQMEVRGSGDGGGVTGGLLSENRRPVWKRVFTPAASFCVSVSHPEHLGQDPVQRPAVAAVCHSTGEPPEPSVTTRSYSERPGFNALTVAVFLQNVLRKVQHQDALQISDVVMASLLRMFQSTAGSGGVQEDALMAVSTLVEGTHTHGARYKDKSVRVRLNSALCFSSGQRLPEVHGCLQAFPGNRTEELR